MEIISDNRQPGMSGSANTSIAMFPADLVMTDVDNNVFTACRDKYQVGENNKRMYRNREWRVMTSRISTITFWGGRLFDCGEYELSSLLVERSKQLKSFVCFPAAGVHMVRPLYCKNNRAGKLLFPALEKITMIDCGSPFDYGLLTPQLKSIEIILSNYDLNAELQEWLMLDKARKLFAENNKLEEIIVVTANTADSSMKRTVHLRILTPHFNFWDKRKLLLLTMYRENPASCLLARLPYDILRNICSMVSGSWLIERNGVVCKVVG